MQGGQRGVRGHQGRRPRDHGGHLPGDQEPRDRPGQGRGEGAGVQGILVKRTELFEFSVLSMLASIQVGYSVQRISGQCFLHIIG